MGHRSIPSKVFVLLYCVVSAYLTNLSQFIASGDGYYELQSTTAVYGILLISHHLSTVHCFKSKCCWLVSRLTECKSFPYRISTWGLTERLPYWTSISFLIKGCDCLAFILFQVCSLSTNRVILPLVPQYEMVASYQRGTCPTTNLASLLSLGTLCAPAYVSAYFRDILRWQITWFTPPYFRFDS